MEPPSLPGPSFLGGCPLLAAKDVETTAAFYRDRLGFSVTVGWSGAWTVLMRGPVEIRLEQSDWSDKVPQSEKGGVGIRVSDVDGLFADFQRRGAPFDQGPMNQEYGHRDFSVIDPNGYRIVFWQPLEELGEGSAGILSELNQEARRHFQ